MSSEGSTAKIHISIDHGFWCLNAEQPPYQKQCADFRTRYCCLPYAQGVYFGDSFDIIIQIRDNLSTI